MNEKYKGIFPALLTPFTADEQINFTALEKLINRLLQKGVSGFYVDGSTGESFLLSMEERIALIKAAARFNQGRGTMIAQVGCIATKDAVQLAETAKEAGYDAVSSVAPFYYRFTFNEIKKYYYDIVNAVDLPMIIYNIPAFSGVTLSVEQMGELLSDPRMIGLKHTSTDYFAMRQFKTAFPDKIIFNGFDETFLAGLSMGAQAAIGSTYNFMPEPFIRIFDLFNRGEIEEAVNLQAETDKIISMLCKYGVMAGEKAILSDMGIPMGGVRAPFTDLTPAQKAELIAIVKTIFPYEAA